VAKVEVIGPRNAPAAITVVSREAPFVWGEAPVVLGEAAFVLYEVTFAL
jgi:hypothetical protein